MMDKLEKDYDYVLYPNTGHAFFNDTNSVTYSETAALDSWAKVQAFLKEKM
jgi:carboxymethylenebutenolidase